MYYGKVLISFVLQDVLCCNVLLWKTTEVHSILMSQTSFYGLMVKSMMEGTLPSFCWEAAWKVISPQRVFPPQNPACPMRNVA